MPARYTQLIRRSRAMIEESRLLLGHARHAERQRRLAMADKHIAIGQKNIARQRQLIEKLERDGHDTAIAKHLLSMFEELQSMHLAHRSLFFTSEPFES